MERTKKFILNNWLPVIHFLLTFIFERIMLLPDDYQAVAFSVPMNEMISISFEQGICYIISKVMAAVIIFAFWKVVFAIGRKKLSRKTVVLWVSIWTISIIFSVLQWPEDFLWGGDNYIPFSYSLRLVPEYWHSIYLSCLYSASMMVIPHAIAISLLQCCFFVFALAYLYYRIESSVAFVNVPWLKYLTLIFLLFRDSFSVSTNPERAEYNATFLLLFISIIGMDIVDHRTRNRKEFVAILIFAVFLAVFRSEGIVVAIPLFLVWYCINYSCDFKKTGGILLIVVALFIIIKIPCKMGEYKYYCKDYSIVNTFSTLQNILNADYSNLSYDGVEEDLESISKLVPVELIAEYGSEGYRRMNYSEGRLDINQSMAGSECSQEYMRAYYSILFHNIPIYLKTQGYMLLNALGAGFGEYQETYNGESHNLEEYGRELWEVGIIDVQNIPGRFRWTNNNVRNAIAKICIDIRMGYYLFVTNTLIYFAINIVLLTGSLVVIVGNIVNFLLKKKKEVGIGIISLVLDAYLLLMALMMPVGANMYFHAYFYCISAVEILSLGMLFTNNAGEKICEKRFGNGYKKYE